MLRAVGNHYIRGTAHQSFNTRDQVSNRCRCTGLHISCHQATFGKHSVKAVSCQSSVPTVTIAKPHILNADHVGVWDTKALLTNHYVDLQVNALVLRKAGKEGATLKVLVQALVLILFTPPGAQSSRNGKKRMPPERNAGKRTLPCRTTTRLRPSFQGAPLQLLAKPTQSLKRFAGLKLCASLMELGILQASPGPASGSGGTADVA